MKKLLSFFAVCALSIITLFSQTPPEAFKYQAVLRGADGKEIASQAVKVRISILEGSATGSLIYRETQSATTNTYGLINLNVGKGTLAVMGTFADIAWGDTTYFIKLEVDPAGGNTFQNMGTTQILSVPYALYSKAAGTVESINGIKLTNNTASIGIGSGSLGPTSYSLLVGSSAGAMITSNSTGSMNTIIGHQAGYKSAKGSHNTFIGMNCGYYDSLGFDNTFIGWSAGTANNLGDSNLFIGVKAGAANTSADLNSFVGAYAGTANTTGANNSFFGGKSGSKNTTGANNTFIGTNAGKKNTTGSGNIFIGNNAGANETTKSNRLHIHSGTTAGDSTQSLIYGDFSRQYVKINDVLYLTPTSAPSNPVEGMMYMDGSTHKLRVYASGSWHDCW